MVWHNKAPLSGHGRGNPKFQKSDHKRVYAVNEGTSNAKDDGLVDMEAVEAVKKSIFLN